MQMIFTAALGRSGTHSLADIFNRYGVSCVAEHEPPQLLLQNAAENRILHQLRALPMFDFTAACTRHFQRSFTATHEMMGRGKALDWYDRGDTKAISKLVTRRLRRIERFAKRGVNNYIECSQFFVRTFAEETARQAPDIGLIKLTRNALECARSLDNRGRRLFLNALPPDRPSNICRVDQWQDLSRFQVFLLQWIEQELRFRRFVERSAPSRLFEIRTNELSAPDNLSALFDYYKIEHRPFVNVQPSNVNLIKTKVTRGDVEELRRLLDRVPPFVPERLPELLLLAEKS